MKTSAALKNRFSCRAYLDKPIDINLVKQLLDTAKHAPSSVNMQQWQVAVVTGETKENLQSAMENAFRDGKKEGNLVQSYPDEWFEPYKSRRKAVGKGMYSALAIGREDKQQQIDQWAKNYRAFDAPVMLLFFLDNDLPEGALLDLGLFMQSLMLLATENNLATCPQFALGEYPSIIAAHLPEFANKKLVCGMALGYPDMNDAVNNWRTERADYADFVKEYV